MLVWLLVLALLLVGSDEELADMFD